MAQLTYSVKIENPCTEDWDKMDQTSVGKFCSNCSKNVIDFSKLTDSEIAKIVGCEALILDQT